MPSCPVFCAKPHRHRVSQDRPVDCPAPDWLDVVRLARAIGIVTRTPQWLTEHRRTATAIAGAYAELGE